MAEVIALQSIEISRFDTLAILKKLASSGRALAELKGLAISIPNQAILINALVMQEAKDSSEIENIVTTHDDLFKDDFRDDAGLNVATKEVRYYRQALNLGFRIVEQNKLLTLNNIIEIQQELERNRAGFRKQQGTTLKDNLGNVIYEPPQNPEDIVHLMTDLEQVINDPEVLNVDPLIKMALIHHQFESIHPFYDGNGRAGRIINVLYLVKEELLHTPILYLSKYIVQTKGEYYRLLQRVRDENDWESWVLYMLDAVEKTAKQTTSTVQRIQIVLMKYKHEIRDKHPKIYSQDLINNLFMHPYTKIEFLMDDLSISRVTATKYLNELTKTGFLTLKKTGGVNYYINHALVDVLTNG
jgi:Fic family protein